MDAMEPQYFVVSFLEYDILKDVTTVRFTEKGKDPWLCESHMARLTGNRLSDFNSLGSVDRSKVLEFERSSIKV